MQIIHSCFYGQRADFPNNISMVVFHERCPECGQWWRKKYTRGSYSGDRRWVPFNIKLWRWRRDARKKVTIYDR